MIKIGMIRIVLAASLSLVLAGSASAGHKSKRHASGVTTGLSADRPQSPVSHSSGQVTHGNEQAKGLVPGNTSADGGTSRNLGGR